jgi:ethanolamine utilization protein EutN
VEEIKSDGRNPKSERRAKPEIVCGSIRLRNSDFGFLSDFGHRVSDFDFMLLARVEGNVVATRKHPSLDGWRLVICQPIGADGHTEGSPQVAIDAHGAGMHQQVVISSDGAAARKAVGDDKSPVRWLVIGIVDEKEPGVRV